LQTTPLFGKIFEIDCENPLHRKKLFEIDCESPGFLRKRPPFKILSMILFSHGVRSAGPLAYFQFYRQGVVGGGGSLSTMFGHLEYQGPFFSHQMVICRKWTAISESRSGIIPQHMAAEITHFIRLRSDQTVFVFSGLSLLMSKNSTLHCGNDFCRSCTQPALSFTSGRSYKVSDFNKLKLVKNAIVSI
jgi:hypothetical protein